MQFLFWLTDLCRFGCLSSAAYLFKYFARALHIFLSFYRKERSLEDAIELFDKCHYRCTNPNGTSFMVETYLGQQKECSERPFVIVLSGGNFISTDNVSSRVTAGLLKDSNAIVFCYHYTCVLQGGSINTMIEDGKYLIRLIQRKSILHNIDAENYALVGFSAGAYLASMIPHSLKKACLPAPNILLLSSSVFDIEDAFEILKLDWYKPLVETCAVLFFLLLIDSPLIFKIQEFEEKLSSLNASEYLLAADLSGVFIEHCKSDPECPIRITRCLVNCLIDQGIQVTFKETEYPRDADAAHVGLFKRGSLSTYGISPWYADDAMLYLRSRLGL